MHPSGHSMSSLGKHLPNGWKLVLFLLVGYLLCGYWSNTAHISSFKPHCTLWGQYYRSAHYGRLGSSHFGKSQELVWVNFALPSDHILPNMPLTSPPKGISKTLSWSILHCYSRISCLGGFYTIGVFYTILFQMLRSTGSGHRHLARVFLLCDNIANSITWGEWGWPLVSTPLFRKSSSHGLYPHDHH